MTKQPGRDIETRFRAFHRTHPWVYDKLVLLAIQAKIAALAVGRRKSGTKRHFEDLRWANIFQLSGVKLDNNHTSRYAREIEKKVRHDAKCRGCLRPTCLVGVFEKRVLRTPSTAGDDDDTGPQQLVLL